MPQLRPTTGSLVTALYVGWAFLCFAGSWATTGRTFGMALLGVMVVRADGADLGFARAAARTVCFPLSFLLFGAGLVLGLFRRDRRELHDLLAGTSVIYAWDAEEAQLRANAVVAATPPPRGQELSEARPLLRGDLTARHDVIETTDPSSSRD